jgi:hypothetical protein
MRHAGGARTAPRSIATLPLRVLLPTLDASVLLSGCPRTLAPRLPLLHAGSQRAQPRSVATLPLSVLRPTLLATLVLRPSCPHALASPLR